MPVTGKKRTLTEAALDAFEKGKTLKESGPAAATLHPNSQPSEPPQTLGGPAVSTDQPKAPGEGENAGAKMASTLPSKPKNRINGRESSDSQSVRQTQQSIPGGPDKDSSTNQETAEIADDDGDEFELSEELAAFIDNLVAEGKTEEEIAEAIEENFEFVEETIEEEKKDKEPDNDKDDMKEEVAENYSVDMSEHIDALFEGEDLSEDFKAKAKTIFEAAVKQVVENELKNLEEAYSETLVEEVEKIEANLSEKMDDYLNFIAEEWKTENEVALDSSLRVEWAENFIGGLKNLFEESYVDIPADKVDVVEELTSAVTELENKLNESLEENVNITKLLAESAKVLTIAELTKDLTETQAEKIKELAEGVAFTDPDTFKTKVQTLKENYFPNKITNDKVLDGVDSSNSGLIQEDTSTEMGRVLSNLRKHTTQR